MCKRGLQTIDFYNPKKSAPAIFDALLERPALQEVDDVAVFCRNGSQVFFGEGLDDEGVLAGKHLQKLKGFSFLTLSKACTWRTACSLGSSQLSSLCALPRLNGYNSNNAIIKRASS